MSTTVEDKPEDLREVLTNALHEMLQVSSLMQPKSDAEFVAVALPNLHLSVFEHVETLLTSQRQTLREEIGQIKKEDVTNDNLQIGDASAYNQALTDVLALLDNKEV